jgi:hypothetical protein
LCAVPDPDARLCKIVTGSVVEQRPEPGQVLRRPGYSDVPARPMQHSW